MISIGGHNFRRLEDEFFVNGFKVYKAYVNGILVYPEGLPEKIEIIVQPTKLVYMNDEMIDLTGAVVVALNADGSRWSSADYPEGIIPIEELSLFPNAYRPHSGNSFVVTDDMLEIPFVYPDGYYEETFRRWSNHQHTGQPYDQTSSDTFETWSRYGRTPAKQTMFAIVSSDRNLYYGGQLVETYRIRNIWRAYSPEANQGYNDFSYTYTYRGLTIGYSGPYYGGYHDFETFDEEHCITISHNLSTNIPLVPEVLDGDNDLLRKALWYTIYGSGGKFITVSWPRPEDNKILTTTLKVYGSTT